MNAPTFVMVADSNPLPELIKKKGRDSAINEEAGITLLVILVG